MDFALTGEQEMIREAARDFADNELMPKAQYWDETREFPTAAVKKLGELGFLGMMVDAKWEAEDFLVVPPGWRVVATYDESIIGAEKTT